PGARADAAREDPQPTGHREAGDTPGRWTSTPARRQGPGAAEVEATPCRLNTRRHGDCLRSPAMSVTDRLPQAVSLAIVATGLVIVLSSPAGAAERRKLSDVIFAGNDSNVAETPI